MGDRVSLTIHLAVIGGGTEVDVGGGMAPVAGGAAGARVQEQVRGQEQARAPVSLPPAMALA